MGTVPATSFHSQPRDIGKGLTTKVRNERRERLASKTRQQERSDNRLTGSEFAEDWALVQRAIAGDADSRRSLFAPYASRLYRIAFAVLRNEQDAEDAVQDGMVKAFTNLGSFQGRSTFSTWLTSITRNAALMARRRKKSRPEASLDQLTADQLETWTRTPVDERLDPEQACGAAEVRTLIDKELSRLPPALRSALHLCMTKDLSTAALAQLLGTSRAAVKSRISRARRQIASEVRQHLSRAPEFKAANEDVFKAQSKRHNYTNPRGALTRSLSAEPQAETSRRAWFTGVPVG